MTPRRGQKKRSSQGSQSEKSKHGAVTFGSKASGNQWQQGPEGAGKQRKGHRSCEYGPYPLVLFYIMQADGYGSRDGGFCFVRHVRRRLPAIQKQYDAEERDSIQQKSRP